MVRSLKGSSLVLAVTKSPPVLSPMTPSVSFPSGFPPPSMTHSLTLGSGSNGMSSISRCSPRRITRDESVQTLEAHVVAVQKSLLDKVR